MDVPRQTLEGPFSQALRYFVDLLEKERVPYALIGGVAVTLLAEQRFTGDVDLTVILDEKQAKKLEHLFRSDPAYEVKQINFISLPTIPDFFRVIWGGTPVDLLVANTEFQKELVARSKKHEVEGLVVRVATPEDLIVLKVLADRPVDRKDVEALMRATASLDWAYIEKWCRVWEIEDRLRSLRGSLKT